LKRAIERLLVHPLSNLMATSQIRAGDWIKADFDCERGCLLFTTEEENLEVHAMANLIGENVRLPALAAAASVPPEQVKTASAKSSKK
jgi:ATP-dependent Clp protease ATP-binding subunit ClpB